MKFIVLSKLDIKYYKLKEPHIVISIRSKPFDIVTMAENKMRLRSLSLVFGDIDKPVEGELLFTKTDAAIILGFVRDNQRDDLTVVCQCGAGISRSAAVAAALSKIYTGKDSLYFKKYVPNRYIYRTMLETNEEIKRKL
jgi:predicted protein tyrosine phosphatase